MQEQRIKELFQRLFNGTITPDEKKLLSEWVQKADNESLEPFMHQTWQTFTPPGTMSGARSDEILQSIMEKATPETTPVISSQTKESHPTLRFSGRYWLAAAALLVVIC